eukprot:TRINITY_DN21811_c0_g1_i1.p1 TRINITY_DN21811_c0_g1~~TRINITY_DN21811_c0_g1_i1.p1  ORF type:complete len:218 (-),score=44.76 TRINITY_DN21811_c0_g1_i1:201-854(-)
MSCRENFIQKNKWWVGILVCGLVSAVAAIVIGSLLSFTQENSFQGTRITSYYPIEGYVSPHQPQGFYWLPTEEEGGCGGKVVVRVTLTGNSSPTTLILSSSTGSSLLNSPQMINSSSIQIVEEYGYCCWNAHLNPLKWNISTSSTDTQYFKFKIELPYQKPQGLLCGLDMDPKILIMWLVFVMCAAGFVLFCVLWLCVAFAAKEETKIIDWQMEDED